MDWLELHKAHIWWPFTQMKLAKEPILVEKGEGVYLYGKDSNQNPIRFIDSISSWWVSIYGHNHPKMKEVIKKQLDLLEHVIFASIVHPSALQLANLLSKKTNDKLPKVFYSDDGSTAMEIAIKMAYQFFQNVGDVKKQKFFTLQNGYHGDTIGTMSVGARSEFHKVYEPLMFDVISIPMQYNSIVGLFDEEIAKEELKEVFYNLELFFEKHHQEACAIVLEPMIQGAAGMLMYHPLLLKKIRELCDSYNVLMICDEVFTGAGRLGTYFAFEKANIYPDIVALSKGLTAGYATFAVTLVKEKIFQGFYSEERKHTLFHGHSMTGNPLGCSVSIRSIQLYEELKIQEKIKEIEKWHKEFLEELILTNVKDKILNYRFYGSVSAIEVKVPENKKNLFSLEVIDFSIKNGALLRPLGNVIYIVPPYIITKEELNEIYKVIYKVLKLII